MGRHKEKERGEDKNLHTLRRYNPEAGELGRLGVKNVRNKQKAITKQQHEGGGRDRKVLWKVVWGG